MGLRSLLKAADQSGVLFGPISTPGPLRHSPADITRCFANTGDLRRMNRPVHHLTALRWPVRHVMDIILDTRDVGGFHAMDHSQERIGKERDARDLRL
jgi:hypothetical protein